MAWKLTEKVQTPVCRLGPVQGSGLHLVSSKGSGGMRTTPPWALAPLPRSSQSPLGHMAVSASSSSETWRCSGTFENEKIKFMSQYPALEGKKLTHNLRLKPTGTFWMSDGSAGKGFGCQCRQPEFESQDPHDGSRKPTPSNCPMTSTSTPWHVHIRNENAKQNTGLKLF